MTSLVLVLEFDYLFIKLLSYLSFGHIGIRMPCHAFNDLLALIVITAANADVV